MPCERTDENTQCPQSRKPTSSMSSLDTQSPEWAEVTDPVERRKIQNKLAQQRFSECFKANYGLYIADIAQEQRPKSKEKKQNVK